MGGDVELETLAGMQNKKKTVRKIKRNTYQLQQALDHDSHVLHNILFCHYVELSRF